MKARSKKTDWSKEIARAKRDLDQNRRTIDSTYKGTKSHKVEIRKSPSSNRSKF
jgi:hypothetical protein